MAYVYVFFTSLIIPDLYMLVLIYFRPIIWFLTMEDIARNIQLTSSTLVK